MYGYNSRNEFKGNVVLNPDCGVYTITSPSGRQYVGSAVSFKRRWRQHRNALSAGRHHCKGLQAAAYKYGTESLRFDIVALVPRTSLAAVEQEQMDERRGLGLYNSLPAAYTCLGRVLSEESKHKISVKLKGRVFTPEWREAMRLAQVGKRQSAETIAARSAALKGREVKPDTRTKISTAQLNRPRPGVVSETGLVGVQKVTDTRFRAQCGQNYVGTFKTAQAAAEAVQQFLQFGITKRLRTNNVSGYAGVFKKNNRWQAQAYVNKKRYYVGSFETPELANEAILAFKASKENT